MKMRSYDYEAPDGSIISRAFWDDEIPDAINLNDRTYLRVKPARGKSAPNGIVKEKRHLAHSLPRKWSGTGIEKIWDKFTPITKNGGGVAYFEGRRDVDEFQSRLADRGGYQAGYRYDDD